MKRSSIKEAFTNEPIFTKFIAKDKDTHSRLLNAIDLEVGEGFVIKPEDQTNDNKRVDLVVRDSANNNVLVIESQDASGWLDPVHASKILYYMFDKGCDTGVLLTEDADEHIKDFVRKINEDTTFSIYVINVLIYDTPQGPFVDFQPLIRPNSLKDKKIRRVDSNKTQENYNRLVQEIVDEYPSIFTNVTIYYASVNNCGNTGMNVAIKPRLDGTYRIDTYHGGKFDNETFKSSYTKFCKDNNLEPHFNSDKGYVKATTKQSGVSLVKLFVKALEDNQITP